MSLTKPIPKPLREEMESDPFYQKCCLSGRMRSSIVEINWHHNFSTYQFGNKGRLNEKWCILPLIKVLHDKEKVREIKDLLNWVMLNRADEETLKKYSKSMDLIALRNRLNKEYNSKEKRDRIINQYLN